MSKVENRFQKRFVEHGGFIEATIFDCETFVQINLAIEKSYIPFRFWKKNFAMLSPEETREADCFPRVGFTNVDIVASSDVVIRISVPLAYVPEDYPILGQDFIREVYASEAIGEWNSAFCRWGHLIVRSMGSHTPLRLKLLLTPAALEHNHLKRFIKERLFEIHHKGQVRGLPTSSITGKATLQSLVASGQQSTKVLSVRCYSPLEFTPT